MCYINKYSRYNWATHTHTHTISHLLTREVPISPAETEIRVRRAYGGGGERRQQHLGHQDKVSHRSEPKVVSKQSRLSVIGEE